ncbi:MAG: M16 family metallopeptidase [Sedimentisphaeraceae bacterium JB056]
MEFKHTKLSNGLSIVGEINKARQSAAVGFFVKTGSRDETSEISGVSHYLEHMLFKGTDKLSAFDVNTEFDRTGAQFNAFTSEENTVFYSAVLPEYLDRVATLWSQMMRPALRDEDFDIEKNVILEEIAMYQDLPHFDVMDRAKSLHFGSHPCGNSVLGTPESIKALTADQMREYFSRRYASDNITVVCCGNFDWDSFCSLVEKECGGYQASNPQRKTDFFAGSMKEETVTKANLARQHICITSASVASQDPRHYAAKLLSNIIGDDSGSRFFWELVDPAIAEVASMYYEDMDGVGVIYNYFQCSKENADKTIDIVNKIFKEVTENGITEQELAKAKHKVLSSLTLKNELPMGRLIEVGFNWVYMKEYKTIQEEINNIKNVTVDDINSILKDFDLRKHSKVILTSGK